ncbi:MAG: hypothetical protein P8I44_01630 [Phycisphaerales bacterium]|nr:hypothetical protein [Phycisphaerales bacterium]
MKTLIRSISIVAPVMLLATAATAEKPTADDWWQAVGGYDGSWAVTLDGADAPALLSTTEWIVPFERMQWRFSEAPGQPMVFETGGCWWNPEADRIEAGGFQVGVDGDLAYRGYIEDVDRDAGTVVWNWKTTNLDGSSKSEITMTDTFGDDVIDRVFDTTSGDEFPIKTAKLEAVNTFQQAMPQAASMVGRWTRSFTNGAGEDVTVMLDVAWGPGQHTLDATFHRKVGDGEPTLRGRRTWMLDRRSGDVWCMNTSANGMRMTAKPKISKTGNATVIRCDWSGPNANGDEVTFSTEETITGDEWTNQWMDLTFAGVKPPNATGEPSDMTTLKRVAG